MSSEQEKTDEELVNLALKEKEFFALLVDRYEASLSRYVRRLGVRDTEDVEDILQDIFIKVYRNLNEFDTALKFSSWVYRIAHNETMSWFRKRSIRPEGHLMDNSEEILSFITSDERSNAAAFDAKRDALAIEEALLSIRDAYRDILILRFFEHKNYDEISDILKIPVSTVGTRIRRAKAALRKNITSETSHYE